MLPAARESHKAQKVLQEQRRAAKPHSTLLVEAKRVWSLARQKTIPTVERQKHVKNLMNVIRGKVKDIVFKHDASRIVQTVVKYGGQKERDEIAAELKGKYKDLVQNKYSKVRMMFFFMRESSLFNSYIVPCDEADPPLPVPSHFNPLRVPNPCTSSPPASRSYLCSSGRF